MYVGVQVIAAHCWDRVIADLGRSRGTHV